MINIIFRGMSKSEFAHDLVKERIESVVERFPDLSGCKINLTVRAENLPLRAGPDLFNVRFHCSSGRYTGIIMEKKAISLFVALADLVEGLLERLNRVGDKKRVKSLKMARRIGTA